MLFEDFYMLIRVTHSTMHDRNAYDAHFHRLEYAKVLFCVLELNRRFYAR